MDRLAQAAASFPPPAFQRLLDADAVEAPRWYQAIVLNEVGVFKGLLESDSSWLSHQHGGRSALEWAIRWGRVGIVRHCLGSAHDVDKECLHEGLDYSLTWGSPTTTPSLWNALVKAGAGVHQWQLIRALSRKDRAGDEFYLKHAEGVLGPQGAARLLVPWTVNLKAENKDDDALAVSAFERALTLPGAKPSAGQMERAFLQWVRMLHEDASAWDVERSKRLDCLAGHWKPSKEKRDNVLMEILKPAAPLVRDFRQKPASGIDQDQVAAKALARIAGWWGLSKNAHRASYEVRVAALRNGPATASVWLSCPAFSPPPRSVADLVAWMGQVQFHTPDDSTSLPAMRKLIRQWAVDLERVPGAAKAADEWAFSPGFRAYKAHGLAFLEGMLEWWSPSRRTQTAIWREVMKHAARGSDKTPMVSLLLAKGWDPNAGLHSLFQNLMTDNVIRASALERTVAPALSLLLSAGADWAAFGDARKWEELITHVSERVGPPGKHVLEEWNTARKLESSLPSAAASTRGRPRM